MLSYHHRKTQYLTNDIYEIFVRFSNCRCGPEISSFQYLVIITLIDNFDIYTEISQNVKKCVEFV